MLVSQFSPLLCCRNCSIGRNKQTHSYDLESFSTVKVQRRIEESSIRLRWRALQQYLTAFSRCSAFYLRCFAGVLDTHLKLTIMTPERYPLTLPAGIHWLKLNNGNIRTMCEICSKLTIKTPERRH